MRLTTIGTGTAAPSRGRVQSGYLVDAGDVQLLMDCGSGITTRMADLDLGIATPADAAMMMRLGAQTVFVGSGIFKSGDPAKRATAIVNAVLFFEDAKKLAEISRNLGEPMVGINVASLDEKELLATRGW